MSIINNKTPKSGANEGGFRGVASRAREDDGSSPASNSITIVLPLPPAALSPNSRGHWARKARAVRSYRRRAAEEARMAMIEAGLPPRVRWRRAEIQVHYFHKTSAFRDKDNIQASLKAAYDGLCDAGLLADDRDIDFPSPVREKDAQRPRVELVVHKGTQKSR